MSAVNPDLFFLNETLIHLCHDKIRREVSRPEPKLRQLVMAANTLDHLSDWMQNYVQERAQERLHQSLRDEGFISDSESDDEDEDNYEDAQTFQAATPTNEMVQQCVITTFEVEESENEDNSDDEWIGLPACSIQKELKREVEMDKSFEESTKPDFRPWKGVSFFASKRRAPSIPSDRKQDESTTAHELNRQSSRERVTIIETAEVQTEREDTSDSTSDSDADSNFDFDSDAAEVESDTEEEDDDSLFMCEVEPKKADAIRLRPSRSAETVIRLVNSVAVRVGA